MPRRTTRIEELDLGQVQDQRGNLEEAFLDLLAATPAAAENEAPPA